jgi:hypothetical protein
MTLLHNDRRLLAERIGHIRQPRALGVFALEAAAGTTPGIEVML